MSRNFKWTQTDVTRGHAIHVDRFLRDFPHYSKLAAENGLTGRGSIVLTEEVTERVKRYFDVSLSFHKPGEISNDLRRMGKVEMEHRQGPVEGFMSPESRGSDKFYIALSAFHSMSVTPTATLVHELGHLVEEQVRLDTNQAASTAFYKALDILYFNGMAADKTFDLRHTANEWVAWVNSVWISKLLNIETQHSLLGMIMDEPGWRGNHNNIVSRSIPALVKFVASRYKVRHQLTIAETRGLRCHAINELSTHFFYLHSMKVWKERLLERSTIPR